MDGPAPAQRPQRNELPSATPAFVISYVAFMGAVAVGAFGQKWPKGLRVVAYVGTLLPSTVALIAGLALSGRKGEETGLEATDSYRPMRDIPSLFQERDLTSLDQMIEHSPIEGDCPKLPRDLSENEINRMHDELVRLEKGVRKVVGGDKYAWETSFHIDAEDDGVMKFNLRPSDLAHRNDDYRVVDSHVVLGGAPVRISHEQYQRIMIGYLRGMDQELGGLYYRGSSDCAFNDLEHGEFKRYRFYLFKRGDPIPRQRMRSGGPEDLDPAKVTRCQAPRRQRVQAVRQGILADRDRATLQGFYAPDAGERMPAVDVDAVYRELQFVEEQCKEPHRGVIRTDKTTIRRTPYGFDISSFGNEDPTLRRIVLGYLPEQQDQVCHVDHDVDKGVIHVWRRQDLIEADSYLKLDSVQGVRAEFKKVDAAMRGGDLQDSDAFTLTRAGDNVQLVWKQTPLTTGGGAVKMGDRLVVFDLDKTPQILRAATRFGWFRASEIRPQGGGFLLVK